jgi:hypothetical protein
MIHDVDELVDIYIEDGILFFICHVEASLNLEDVKILVKKRLDACDGNSYPTLLEFNKTKNYATKEAREYLATEGEKGVSSVAFVTSSIATKLFINLYLTFYKPNMPFKMFTNRQSAVIWLKQFVPSSYIKKTKV